MVYDPGDCFAITEGKEVPEVYISQPSLLIFRDCQGEDEQPKHNQCESGAIFWYWRMKQGQEKSSNWLIV